MATSRHVSYCQASQDKTTQYESTSKEKFDDGSETLTVLETIVDKVAMIEEWINRENDTMNAYIKHYQMMKERFEEGIAECKLQLLSMLRKQEEKTRELKKLNLLIFETTDETEKRTDEQSKKRAENLCRLAANTKITVQWAKQLDNCLPGMFITRVRFFTVEDKMRVMAGEENLFSLGVYIDHDLTKNELKMQKTLDEMAEQGRASGKVTFMKEGTVCINGTLHTLV